MHVNVYPMVNKSKLTEMAVFVYETLIDTMCKW